MATKQCRFCLKADTLLIDIYKKSNAGTPATVLHNCIPNFKAMETSDLPRFICFKCYAFVGHMNSFLDMTKISFGILTGSSQKLKMSQTEPTDFETHSSGDESIIKTMTSQLSQPFPKLLLTPPTSLLSNGSLKSSQRTQPAVHKTKSYKMTPLKQAKTRRFKTHSNTSQHRVNITIKSPARKSSPSVKVEVITNERKHFNRETDDNTPSSKISLPPMKNYCSNCRKSLPPLANLFEHTFAVHSEK